MWPLESEISKERSEHFQNPIVIRRPLANPREYSHILETRIIALHFAADMVYLRSHFFGGFRKTIFSARVHFGRSRSSKVIDFGTSRKRVCDFLLVRHSNLVMLQLHRFGDIAVFCAHAPSLIPP